MHLKKKCAHYIFRGVIMERFLKIVGLKKEAILLDSKLYIVKSMLAIGTAFILGRTFDVTRLDMISVLLGVMYNLEATNTSTVKSGFNQLIASFLGALTTGTLVFFFGVNAFTVMLGMGLTLFIALKIDYRGVHPVAIFTSIYMTQYIQLDALGDPSIFLTIRLRILALGLGVLIAIVFNYGFSFFYYKRIGQKRLAYLQLKIDESLELTYSYLTTDHHNHFDYENLFSVLFADIEMVRSNVTILKGERFIPFKNIEKNNMTIVEDNVRSLKVISHMAYDSCYVKDYFGLEFSQADVKPLKSFITAFSNIDFLQDSSQSSSIDENEIIEFKTEGVGRQRIYNNMDLMNKEYIKIMVHR